jgi:hypothetical protein
VKYPAGSWITQAKTISIAPIVANKPPHSVPRPMAQAFAAIKRLGYEPGPAEKDVSFATPTYLGIR